MTIEIIVSLIADDRPGLVQDLSRTVADAGGNWIDSSFARLGGQFAGIVRVSLPSAGVQAFESSLARLRRDGVEVSLRHDASTTVLNGTRARLELTGSDHPGIVHDISTALAAHGVSILDLKTEIFTGSMSGNALFSAIAEIVVPDGVSDETLRHELEAIANDIMVEINLTPLAIDA